MKEHWDKIDIYEVDIPELGPSLYVGQTFPISIKVFLGEITPEDVMVEVISGMLDSQEQIQGFAPVLANLNGTPEPGSDPGHYIFTGEVTCNESGRFGITTRIVPKNDNLPHTIKPKLINWW
jgi:starch phosphorylase